VGRRGRVALLVALATFLACTSVPAVTVQSEGLRISAFAQVKPYKLPRRTPAPIAVFVAGHLQSATGGIAPQLRRMTVEVNRHGLLQSRGLAVCEIAAVQPGSTSRALANCGDALIGSGQFWANIVLPEQGAYRTQGRLLIFNGREGNRPLLLAHIYTTHPFASSFVIPFAIAKIRDGPYGTRLRASLPQALGDWGYLDRIKLTLKRKYTYRGKQLSYFNSACPAPGNAPRTSFPLARATFHFAQRKPILVGVEKTCAVSE
jgi:hypothetical protein